MRSEHLFKLKYLWVGCQLSVFILMYSSCKPRQTETNSEVADAGDWKPDPPPDQLDVGMQVDVCPQGFSCKHVAKRTGKKIIDGIPPELAAKRTAGISQKFKLRVKADIWHDFTPKHTYFKSNGVGNLISTSDKVEPHFQYKTLANGRKLIMYSGGCITNMGYNVPIKITPCDDNNVSQQMTWDPGNDLSSATGSFIWNQNVCLDVNGGNSVVQENLLLIFYNCKNWAGMELQNFNQRFNAEY